MNDVAKKTPQNMLRKLNLIGVSLLVLMVGGIGGWAATSELAGAVVAPGSLVVESNVKKVQHSTGGIVGKIFVKDGSQVEAGEVVVRLDETLTKATLGIVRSQLYEMNARLARLLSERDGADSITFPADLLEHNDDAQVSSAVTGETKLFESRRTARQGQRAQLRERISQNGEEVRGLTAQTGAKESEIQLITEELVGVGDLYKKNLVTITRFNVLQRDKARINGERGQLIAETARARAKISETELQIIQLDQDFRTEVLRDLREIQGKVAEMKERVFAAEDQLKRVDIRAPQSGTVHQLAVHTEGGVIANGEAIMMIVPRADQLVVEARITPQDVDQVVVGTKVSVRIMAGNQRTTPDISGLLTRVAPDLTREQQTNQAYYVVRIVLDEDQVKRLSKHLTLVAGMPATAFIQTSMRTPLQYVMKPLNDQISRTFRER